MAGKRIGIAAKVFEKTLSIFDVNTEVKRQVEEIERAGIVIGISRINNEHVRTRGLGASEFSLAAYFPNLGFGLENLTA